MNTFIYALVDPRNQQIRYIGKSNKPKDRFISHMSDKNLSFKGYKNSWIKSLLKENLKPELIIIDEIPEKEWEFWEKHYISLYKSWGFKLTNKLEGGQAGPRQIGNKNMLGKKHSDKTKDIISKKNILNRIERGKKISEGRKGKSWEEFYGKEKADILKQKKSEFNKINSHFKNPKFIEEHRKRLKGKKRTPGSIVKWRESIKGYVVSLEVRQKMSENRKGIKNGNAKGSILQYDLEGNFIQEFQTGQDAANSLGIKSFGNISSCIKGKLKTAHGYIWKRKETINVEALNEIVKKHALINSYIERGEEIPFELRKNFITFPLTEDPYSLLK